MNRVGIFILLLISGMIFFATKSQAQSNTQMDSLRDALISAKIITAKDFDNLERRIRLANDTLVTKKHSSSSRKQRRSITNYRFVASGDIAAGLSVSYATFKSDDSQFFSMLKDFNCKLTAFGINPFAAYFYSDNRCVGAKFGYTKIDANLDNINVDIDEDLNFDMTGTRLNYSQYNMVLFHRTYVGLDAGHRFGLFNETNLTYSWGDMNYVRNLANGEKNTHTDMQQIRIGLNPGISVFAMDKFTVEASVGIAGFKLKREQQITDGVKSGWRKTASMDYKLNIFNIQIGIVAYL